MGFYTQQVPCKFSLTHSPSCFIVYAAQFLRSAHDAYFVAVFVNVRAVFTLIWPLVFQPSEALYIDHIAGLQVSDRLRRSGCMNRFRSRLWCRRWSCVGSCGRFHKCRLRLICGFMGMLRLWSRSLFFLCWQIDFCFQFDFCDNRLWGAYGRCLGRCGWFSRPFRLAATRRHTGPDRR